MICHGHVSLAEGRSIAGVTIVTLGFDSPLDAAAPVLHRQEALQVFMVMLRRPMGMVMDGPWMVGSEAVMDCTKV